MGGRAASPLSRVPEKPAQVAPSSPRHRGGRGHHMGNGNRKGVELERVQGPLSISPASRAAVRWRTRVRKEQSPRQLPGRTVPETATGTQPWGQAAGGPSSISPPARCVICSFTRPRSAFYANWQPGNGHRMTQTWSPRPPDMDQRFTTRREWAHFCVERKETVVRLREGVIVLKKEKRKETT